MSRKKSMVELHRVGVEEYKQAAKLPVTVVLDNVRSEMNVGSVFRTADAFLIERICLCGITPPLGLGMYAGMSLAESEFGKTFKNNLWWVAAQFVLEVIVLMGWLPILGL